MTTSEPALDRPHAHIDTWQDLPRIELYLDQVLTLTQEQLAPFDLEDEDRMLTASMVNNYVKQKLLPPPQRKRYQREQVSRLIIVAVLKQVLSIAELDMLLRRLEAIPAFDAEALHNRFVAGLELAMARIVREIDRLPADTPLPPQPEFDLSLEHGDSDADELQPHIQTLEALDLAITACVCRWAARRRLLAPAREA